MVIPPQLLVLDVIANKSARCEDSASETCDPRLIVVPERVVKVSDASLLRKEAELIPSSKSASNPEPAPSTVLILVSTSAAVYEEDANLAFKAVCKPSTLLITWLCESSAIVTAILVVPEPETSPLSVIVWLPVK